MANQGLVDHTQTALYVHVADIDTVISSYEQCTQQKDPGRRTALIKGMS
jgi:hypothetical protein